MGVHWKTRFLRVCVKNQYIGGEMPKMRAWIVCRCKRWLCKKKGVDVFEMELRPQCILWVGWPSLLTQIFKKITL